MSVWTVAPVMEMPSGDHLDRNETRAGFARFHRNNVVCGRFAARFLWVAAAAWANAEAAMAMPRRRRAARLSCRSSLNGKDAGPWADFLSQAGSPYCLSAAR